MTNQALPNLRPGAARANARAVTRREVRTEAAERPQPAKRQLCECAFGTIELAAPSHKTWDHQFFSHGTLAPRSSVGYFPRVTTT